MENTNTYNIYKTANNNIGAGIREAQANYALTESNCSDVVRAVLKNISEDSKQEAINQIKSGNVR